MGNRAAVGLAHEKRTIQAWFSQSDDAIPMPDGL
jgi:hypothetical protein